MDLWQPKTTASIGFKRPGQPWLDPGALQRTATAHRQNEFGIHNAIVGIEVGCIPLRNNHQRAANDRYDMWTENCFGLVCSKWNRCGLRHMCTGLPSDVLPLVPGGEVLMFLLEIILWIPNLAVLLWMEEILHQLIGGLSHYLLGFNHPRWCRISSIHRKRPSHLGVGFPTILDWWQCCCNTHGGCCIVCIRRHRKIEITLNRAEQFVLHIPVHEAASNRR